MKKSIKEKMIDRLGVPIAKSLAKAMRPSEMTVSVIGDCTVSNESNTIDTSINSIKNFNGDITITIKMKY